MRRTYRSNRLFLCILVGMAGALLGGFLAQRPGTADLWQTLFVVWIGVVLLFVVIRLLTVPAPFSQ